MPSTTFTTAILEKSPTEAFLSIIWQEKNGYVNTIQRIFIVDDTEYCFCVRERRSSAFNAEELAHWQQVLRQIKLKADSAVNTVASF